MESGKTRLGIECEYAVARKARYWARWAAVVVLPLPPLKLTTVMT